MRFALLGDHPDGIDMAIALAATGRHRLEIYSGSPVGYAQLEKYGHAPRKVGDLEEVLANDDIDAVIIAGAAGARGRQLRRALQSECHVLCVHPADPSPDAAYEAALIQSDTGRVLLPLMPMALHLGIVNLGMTARMGRIRLVELEMWSHEEVMLDGRIEGHKPSLPGWDVLRVIGGEIAEIYAQAPAGELDPRAPLVVSGRFQNGVLLQATYMPMQSEPYMRVSLVTTMERIELVFAQGFPGPSVLTCIDDTGQPGSEAYEHFHPWQALVAQFERALTQAAIRKPQPGRFAEECLTLATPQLGWLDELRALELDDAARRSAERGRSSTLDHQEATEEASFKGTMTLVGCSLIWLAVALLIVSVWVNWMIWLILPLFGVFLFMQALRWVVPRSEEPTATSDE